MSFSADKKLGNLGERKVIEYLNLLPENQTDPYHLFHHKYSLYDLRNSKVVAEVKARRNASTTYPTTIIGYNKIKILEGGLELDTEYHFLFLFTDGLFRWKFQSGQYQVALGGRCDRGKREIKDYCYIKIEDCELLTTSIHSFA